VKVVELLSDSTCGGWFGKGGEAGEHWREMQELFWAEREDFGEVRWLHKQEPTFGRACDFTCWGCPTSHAS
jgi:hypothetical protein